MKSYKKVAKNFNPKVAKLVRQVMTLAKEARKLKVAFHNATFDSYRAEDLTVRQDEKLTNLHGTLRCLAGDLEEAEGNLKAAKTVKL